MTRIAIAPQPLDRLAERLTEAGRLCSRYGLVIVLAWIGFGKWVKFEAQVLVAHSPVMSWVFDVLSPAAVGRVLGSTELLAAVLIATAPRAPRLSALGSALGVVLFLGTLSLLLTSPGVVSRWAIGLPVLSSQPGQFLLKDLVLLGVSISTLGESLRSYALRGSAGPATPAGRG